ncbi:cytochrome c oxidase assembly factor 4 homolog, mitochondrial-like [Bactrocera tryoni]|uniref:cytochrome c oxidase assembly factor 4 homolog, mitochondrial-like n=1 Tax=Bactrocera tryoni TaxID=59916 RepID=UPI001A95FEF5|nr:cytochrome c oxidase assembly factor 4 homolog, mitochondrial-like [Bactrocera tryoni]XP_039956936.1 cytochrome c oxidase assembly factor 4 homolog, mitochondrial-like [Bactrocera tryoni]
MSSVSAAAALETEDPVELMLKKTGCIELHYKVQECIAETGDWRRCQEAVKEFKQCMQKYTEAQMKKYAQTK